MHAVADQVDSGLVAGIEQEDAVVQQLQRSELFALDLALDQPRQYVGLGVAGVGAAVGDQTLEGGQERAHSRMAACQQRGVRRRLQRRQDR